MNKALRRGKFKSYYDSRFYNNWVKGSNLTYEKWLRLQPKAIQNCALGKARAALFRSGQFFIESHNALRYLHGIQQLAFNQADGSK